MESIHKILVSCYFILFTLSCFSQNDSVRNKHQIYLSFNIGLPLYNNFGYRIDNYNESVNSYTKLKPSFNFSFDHNINHFTINMLYNYSLNEFTGAPYLIEGTLIGTRYHNSPVYKEFEIYQKIKYNYLQVGMGLGYNHWIKKHNISLTTNVIQNVYTKIIISSYYVNNSPHNDQDTASIALVKNFHAMGVDKSLAIYANMKLMYTYALRRKIHLMFSLSSSFGLLNNYSTSTTPYYDNGALGYRINYQKMIYISTGIRFKVF